jgi:hypothetical protein
MSIIARHMMTSRNRVSFDISHCANSIVLFVSSSFQDTDTFVVDVLVPVSFNMQNCHNLYLDPFHMGIIAQYFGTRSLRDNIILLRRMAG